MRKTIVFKQLTAVLLAASLLLFQSCRKLVAVSPAAMELPSMVVPSGIVLENSATLQVSTVAGNGIAGYADAIGTAAKLNFPYSVATDTSGNVIIADTYNNRIRKINVAGVVSTIAGSGTPGYLDGIGSGAQFNAPSGVATDVAGNIYVADKNNHLIRKITPDGTVSTLAGGAGMPGNTEGPGIAARFNFPIGVAVDLSGNIVVADSANHKIRSVSPTGFVNTLAGNGTKGTTNGPASFSQFNGPTGVTADVSGNVYVADAGNHKIRKIAGGLVSTLTGGGSAGAASGFADGSATDARFNNPTGVVADGAGNIYVADKFNNSIRQINTAGAVTTLSGNGTVGFVDGVVSVARFNSPAGIAMDARGRIFVADQTNQRIRRIAPRVVTVSTFAGNGVAGRVNGIGAAAQFSYPIGLCATATNLLVAEAGNHDVRMISYSNSEVSTVVGFTGGFGYRNGFFQGALFNAPTGVTFVPSSSALFITDLYNNSIREKLGFYVYGYAGSTSPGYADGQYSNARFNNPTGITSDASGNLYVADWGNHRIRKISPSGFVSTLAGGGVAGFADGQGTAAKFNGPYSVAVDANGNVYVAEIYNSRIRKISPSGMVSTLAGNGTPGFANGTSTSAQFNWPYGVAVDAAGTVYVADFNNHAVRMITASGEVSTLAGTPGVSGHQDGLGHNSMFNAPIGIAVDPSGNIYVSDYFNHRIRKISIQ